MIKIILKKLSAALFLSTVVLFNLCAELNIIPMAEFGALQLKDDNYLFSPSGTLMFKYQKDEEDTSNMPDVIAASLSYGQDIISKGGLLTAFFFILQIVHKLDLQLNHMLQCL